MPYTTLTNLTSGQDVLEEHMDDIRSNIEFVAGLLIRGTAISALSDAAQIATRIYWSKYTGTGGNNVAITGVGFQPEALIIFGVPSESVRGSFSGGWFVYTGSANLAASGGVDSLDADGFTVSDDGQTNSANESAGIYYYMAIRRANA